MADELLGKEYLQLVEGLLSRLDRVQKGDTSTRRILLLTGPSGVGKSRIVREVYRRLQSEQSLPAYWPKLEESTTPGQGAGVDPMPGRKVLGPPTRGFVWPAHALPSFSWWDLDCQRLANQSLLNAIAQARPSLETHLLPTELAYRDVTSWPARLLGSKEGVVDRVREVFIEGGLGAAEEVLKGFDVALPGLGTWLGWLRRGAAAYGTHRAEQAALRVDTLRAGEIAVREMSAARALASIISGIAHPQVPAVIVIEDLHLMDEELSEFLGTVAYRDPSRPVLVIGTAWPEGEGPHNRVYDQWRRRGDVHGTVHVQAMPKLESADLCALVRRHAPSTDAETATRITNLYPNPLMLHLFCTLDETQERVVDGRLELSPDELTDLPHGIGDLYEARWRELPPAAQIGLSLAAASISHPNRAYLPDLVAHAASTIKIAPLSGDPLKTFQNLAATSAWTLPETNDVGGWYQFREPLMVEVAGRYTLRSRAQKLRSALRSDLNEKINSQRIGLTLPVTSRPLALWLTDLTPAHEEHTVAESSAAFAVADELARLHRPAEAAELLQHRYWHTAFAADDPNALTVRRQIASWLAESGRLQAAIQQFRAIVADSVHVLGEDHPDTLNSRDRLAVCLAQYGQLSVAMLQLKQLITDRTRHLGPTHPDTLATRNHLFHWQAYSGQVKAAVAELEQLLAEENQALGPDHPHTLATRENLAYWQADSGQVELAIEQFRQLLADTKRVLGIDHPSTLTTRKHLAHSLATKGQLSDAIDEGRHLLSDLIRVLGDKHPDVLDIRDHVAAWLAEAGQLDEAIALGRQVLTDHLQILGPEHPETLKARNTLATSLARAGQHDHAIAHFAQLLADRSKILEQGHPDNLATRNNLAFCLTQTHQPEAALAQYRELLRDATRIYGSEHPSTLIVRQNIGASMAASDRTEDALQHFRQLLNDRTRVLGPDHPDTLLTRTHLARSLASSGMSDDAIAQLRENLTRSIRVRGADHPDTLSIRNDLAAWLAERGQNDRP